MKSTKQRPYSAISGKEILREFPQSYRAYTAVTTKCLDTNFYVGHILAISGAFTQGETLEELNENLKEVISILNDDDKSVIINNNFVDNKTYDSM